MDEKYRTRNNPEVISVLEVKITDLSDADRHAIFQQNPEWMVEHCRDWVRTHYPKHLPLDS